jgi:hypothetical protein
MPTIAQNGRWRIEVIYHEEVTIYSTWADACTYYVEDTTTGKIFNTYDWSRNEMCEQSGPVSVSFTEDGRAILLKYHDGSTSIEPLPDEE